MSVLHFLPEGTWNFHLNKTQPTVESVIDFFISPRGFYPMTLGVFIRDGFLLKRNETQCLMVHSSRMKIFNVVKETHILNIISFKVRRDIIMIC